MAHTVEPLTYLGWCIGWTIAVELVSLVLEFNGIELMILDSGPWPLNVPGHLQHDFCRHPLWEVGVLFLGWIVGTVYLWRHECD